MDIIISYKTSTLLIFLTIIHKNFEIKFFRQSHLSSRLNILTNFRLIWWHIYMIIWLLRAFLKVMTALFPPFDQVIFHQITLSFTTSIINYLLKTISTISRHYYLKLSSSVDLGFARFDLLAFVDLRCHHSRALIVDQYIPYLYVMNFPNFFPRSYLISFWYYYATVCVINLLTWSHLIHQSSIFSFRDSLHVLKINECFSCLSI